MVHFKMKINIESLQQRVNMLLLNIISSKHFARKSVENVHNIKQTNKKVFHAISSRFFLCMAKALFKLSPAENLHVGLIIYITTIRTCLKVENDQTFWWIK